MENGKHNADVGEKPTSYALAAKGVLLYELYFCVLLSVTWAMFSFFNVQIYGSNHKSTINITKRTKSWFLVYNAEKKKIHSVHY